MPNNQRNNRGIIHIGVIVSIILILAIASAAWFVWTKNDNNRHAETPKTETNQNKPTESEQPNDNEGGKYLVIEEWGVQITLPESLRGDIYYSVNQKAQLDFGVDMIEFSSRKFDTNNLQCALSGGARSLASVERISFGDNDPDEYEPKPFKIINPVLYRFTITSCEDAINQEGTPQDKQLLVDLKKAINETLTPYE